MIRHILIERALAETKALQVLISSEYEQKLRQDKVSFTCKKGCAYCCHHPFYISILEGVLLYKYIITHGYWTANLQNKLKKHQEKTSDLNLGVWLLSNIPCPLLENDTCLAYDVRPLHCRMTYSIRDPQMCHPHELGDWTGILPNSENIIAYNIKLQGIMKRIELPGFVTPLSEAVLSGVKLES
jgi:Fe-S-cluster containining protein